MFFQVNSVLSEWSSVQSGRLFPINLGYNMIIFGFIKFEENISFIVLCSFAGCAGLCHSRAAVL